MAEPFLYTDTPGAYMPAAVYAGVSPKFASHLARSDKLTVVVHYPDTDAETSQH